MSFASATTHKSVASRRSSVQIAHGSSSVSEKQREQSRTRSFTAKIASASASASARGRLSRKKTRRAAVFGPTVGSFENSLIRLWMGPAIAFVTRTSRGRAIPR